MSLCGDGVMHEWNRFLFVLWHCILQREGDRVVKTGKPSIHVPSGRILQVTHQALRRTGVTPEIRSPGSMCDVAIG